MRRRRKCRLWWPSDLISQTPSKSTFLFGWFVFSSEDSLDIIVACAFDDSKLSSTISHNSDLQEILQRTNKNMPALLQDKCKFSLLGYCEADFSGNSQSVRSRNDKNKHCNLTSNRRHLNKCTSNHGSPSCGCPKLDGLSEQFRLVALENMWIKLVYDLSETIDGQVDVFPKLDHIHWTREAMFHLDLHVIVYDTPTFGGHHYSLGKHGSSNLGTSCKTPKWFDDLHQTDPHLELDTVICAINSANAAQMLFSGHAEPGFQFHIVCMLTTFAWELFSVSVASLSTIIYIILQSFHILCSWVSNSYIYAVLAKVFSNTWQNIRIRCCQLLYWPILLHDQSIRHRSCVEFAEKAAFHKHSMWSNVVVDVLLGNLIGIALWFMAEPACLWISGFAHDITNYWLRNGCVWLIGNPAGFKVNTELAGVLGMISLTAVQIWSTLWGLMGSFFLYFTKGLALCGILFGLTAAAALVIDIISVVTMHVLTLHLFLSLLYSTQIQTVAALWRIFGGRKWNPLRHRLDSYDYTVEQHVVASLLFTPISLLLPTTSAFYIFFTILHTAVCFICIVVGFVISFVHATPYAKIFLWLKRKERFPSGIWFEVISCQNSETGAVSGSDSSPGTSSSNSTVLVSFLHSNYLKLGEVVWPHYRYIFSGFSRSSISSSAYGLLTGTSVPSALRTGLPPELPWIAIPWKEYWRLCHNAVYACRPDPYSH